MPSSKLQGCMWGGGGGWQTHIIKEREGQLQRGEGVKAPPEMNHMY